MAKDRERRYSSAADLFAAIEELRSAAPQPASRTEQRLPEPIFGRDEELRRLEELLKPAVRSAGNVVMISHALNQYLFYDQAGQAEDRVTPASGRNAGKAACRPTRCRGRRRSLTSHRGRGW